MDDVESFQFVSDYWRHSKSVHSYSETLSNCSFLQFCRKPSLISSFCSELLPPKVTPVVCPGSFSFPLITLSLSGLFPSIFFFLVLHHHGCVHYGCKGIHYHTGRASASTHGEINKVREADKRLTESGREGEGIKRWRQRKERKEGDKEGVIKVKLSSILSVWNLR